MDFKTALLQEHSKAQALKVTAYIGSDPERFGQLIDLLLHSSYRLAQRASWVAVHCVAAYPPLIQPHLVVLAQHLSKTTSDTVKRNILRMMQDIALPEALWGEVADSCFGFLMDRKSAIAIKVFAMTVLAQITEQVPELKDELKLVIEDQLPYGSPAFLNRAQKVLQALKKSSKRG